MMSETRKLKCTHKMTDEWKEMVLRFELFADNNDLDLNQHPLHFLYLDNKTSLAWKAFKIAWQENARERVIFKQELAKKEAEFQAVIDKAEREIKDKKVGCLILHSMMEAGEDEKLAWSEHYNQTLDEALQILKRARGE